MNTMKTKMMVAQGVTMALLAGAVLGHGFPAGFGGGTSSAAPASGFGRPTGSGAPGAGPRGATPRGPGGVTNPRGTGGATRSGMKREDAPDFKGEPKPDAASPKGGSGAEGSSGAPLTPADHVVARSREFAAQMMAQAAAIADRTTTLDVQAADLSLKPVTFRVRLTEIREKNVSRRVEILRKDGEKWISDETFVVKSEPTGRTTVWRKDAAGKVTELAPSLAETRVQGSSVRLADLLPFDASAYDCTLETPAAPAGEQRETFVVKMKGSGTITARATFDPITNRVLHIDWLAGGVRMRASDWSGWRVTGGVQMPSRVTILGGGLEPIATLDVVEARINTKPDASLVDPLRLKN